MGDTRHVVCTILKNNCVIGEEKMSVMAVVTKLVKDGYYD